MTNDQKYTLSVCKTKLESYFSACIDSNSLKNTILSIVSYIKLYKDTKEFEPFIKGVASEKVKDCKAVEKLKEKVDSETSKQYKEVLTFVSNNRLNDRPELVKDLENLKLWEAGKIYSSDPTLIKFWDFRHLLVALSELDDGRYKDFAYKYATVDKEGKVMEWLPFKAKNDLEEENDKLERLTPLTLWNALDNLENLYGAYLMYRDVRHWLLENSQYITAVANDYQQDDLKSILEGGTQKYNSFQVEELRGFIRKLHTDLIIFVDRIIASYGKPSEISFVRNPPTLYIKGQTIEFKRKKAFGYDILQVIFSNKAKQWEVYKIMVRLGVINEKGIDPISQEQTARFIRACRNINEYVNQQAGFDKFLIYSSEYAQINPSYLK